MSSLFCDLFTFLQFVLSFQTLPFLFFGHDFNVNRVDSFSTKERVREKQKLAINFHRLRGNNTSIYNKIKKLFYKH